MNISDLVPTLQPLVNSVNQQLRFVCFFVLTGSLIVRTGTGSLSVHQMVRPIVTTALICGLIATQPTWFNLLRDTFWNVAVTIRTTFTGSVDGTGTALLQLLQPPDTGTNWIDVGSSIMKAVQYALGWIIICFAGLIQLPMMILQYVMQCLCYLFLPIAISLFAFESTKGIAMRYIQQTLAILAWPIGFAVVDLVGFALLTQVQTSTQTGQASHVFNPAGFVSGGIVAIWLIVGSLATPFAMQALFCGGTPLSSSLGQAGQIAMSLSGMLRAGGSFSSGSKASPSGANPSSSSSAQSQPPSSPPALPGPPATPLLNPPGSGSSSGFMPFNPMPSGTNGFVQTDRGSLAVGKIADRISPAQGQAIADQSGTSFTQAMSNGQVVTYQPNPSGSQPSGSSSRSGLIPNPIPL